MPVPSADEITSPAKAYCRFVAPGIFGPTATGRRSEACATAGSRGSDAEGAIGREGGFVDQVREEFGKFLDLAKLGGHAFARVAAVVGDAEGAEPGSVGGNHMGFRVVVGGGCSGFFGRFNF